VRLAEVFATKEIVEQLEHVRKLQFRKSELVWLAGNTFYGHRGIFERAFLEWLEQDFKLSDYELSVTDGQFHLSFEGYWPETTMWELYALSIFDELRTRASMKKLSEFYLDILYARAKTKLSSKIERLRGVPSLEIPKPDGQGVRKLGIPCVLDRFVQQAVFPGPTRRRRGNPSPYAD
jgi:nicotinate phosphoribosyltransferase